MVLFDLYIQRRSVVESKKLVSNVTLENHDLTLFLEAEYIHWRESCFPLKKYSMMLKNICTVVIFPNSSQRLGVIYQITVYLGTADLSRAVEYWIIGDSDKQKESDCL